MKRGISAIASAALLGGSLFLGAGAANAIVCPAGQHAITMGGISDCVPDASGGGTGGNIVYNGGGSPNTGAPAPIQVPGYNAPGTLGGGTVTAPAPYHPVAPVQAPAAPAAPQAPQYVPAAPQAPAYNGGSVYRPTAPGQAPAFTPAGGGTLTKNPQGVWVDSQTGVAADASVAAQAAAAEAAPEAAPEAAAPEAAAAQAAAQAQQAKEAAVKKSAELAIVRVQIETAVSKALDDALARH